MGFMGSRVSKEEVTFEHFYLRQVCSKNQYNKQLLVTLVPLTKQDEYADWENIQKNIKRMDTVAVMVPESFEKEEIKKAFTCCQCNSDFQLAITFEKFDFVLRTQFIKNKQINKYYTEEELFLILRQLLQSAKQFQLQNIRVGDIRPANIAVTYRGQIKMITTATLPYECTAIDKVMNRFNTTDIFYFAPEEINFIEAKGYASKEDCPNPKTEAFSIGLTVLEAALFENSQELYEMPKRKFKSQQLAKRMRKLKGKFDRLYVHLQRILHLDSFQRLNSGEAWAHLKPYSESITKLKKFSLNPKSEEQCLVTFNTTGFRKSK